MIKDTSNAPYFDDFSETKNFLRVLFTPSKAVQARELTQAQTILQNQIQHLGDGIYVDNSRVLGAETTVDFSKHTIVVTVDTLAVAVDIDTLLGASIADAATGTDILATVTSVDKANNALLLTYHGGIFSPTDTFKVVGGTTEYVIDNDYYSITASTTNGLVYTDGFFVHVFESEIVVDSSPTAQTSKHHIGFTIADVLVDENIDTSLTDNALGSYNYNAPGAHRLKRDLILSSYIDGNTPPTGFLASIIIDNAVIITNIMKEIKYSEILDVMARRTYDESGNYVTEEFAILPAVTALGNPNTQLDLEVGVGKAYVFGYETENTIPKFVTIDKSQTTKEQLNSTVYTTSGPFFDIAKDATGIDKITGTFDVEGKEQILFYTSYANALADIGGVLPDISASGVTPKIASMARNSLGEVRLFTVNTQGLSSQFNSVRAIRGKTSGAIATIELYGGLPVLGGTTDTPMMFPVQEEYISDIPVASIAYDITKAFINQTAIVGDVVTIAQTNAATDSFYDGSGKVVFVRANGVTIPEGAAGWSIDVAATIPSSLVLNLTAWATANATTVTSVDVTIVCQRTLNEKTKTLLDNTVGDVIATPANPILTLTGYDVTDVYEVSVVGHSTIPDGVLAVNEYAWSTGQTDVSYGYGAVSLSTNAYDVLATYTVKYKHFSHSSVGDYFTVNSYAGIAWEDIASYTTSFGDVLPLTDVFDYRKAVGGLGLYPTGETYITFDFSFYLARIDKLYVDRYGAFGTITGLPSKTPFAPADKSDVMTLSTITLHPQTGVVEEVIVDSISDKGYTMQDIKELEGRIADLEYYSSLNLLEQGAKDLLVTDGYGNNRFKNGIFVDSFSSHEFGSVDHPDYNCSMDTSEGFIHSPFVMKNHGLETALLGNSAGQVSANIAIADDKISDSSASICTLDYTTTPFISQTKASDKINVNPYAVFAWNQGQITISPTSDFWYDDVSLPIIRRTTGSYAGVGVKYSAWRSWSQSWSGISVSSSRRWGWNQTTTTSLNTTTRTTSNRTVITTRPTLSKKVDDKVVDTSAIPYMRSRAITFWGKNFRPNTVVKVFFDDVDVTANCTSPSGFITDSEGKLDSKASPGVFLIPAGQFKTGTKQIILKDVGETTEGSTEFKSTGILRKNQRTITSIRGVTSSVSTQTSISQTTTSRIISRRRWGDPIAQSFLVEKEGGIFVSSVDLFFAKKDSALPVSCEIVEMLAGIPTQNVIPLSYKVVDAANVQVSNDSSLATTFEFEAPIYLQDGTSYAFVVKSNSVNYEMFYAKMTHPELLTGDNVYTNVKSGQGISKQPYAGVMFKSQNAETWTEDQNADVKFVINRCVFNTASNGVVEFNIATNTALDLTQFSSNIHNITYQDTSIAFDYKFLNDVGYTPISDAEDEILLAEKVIAASPSSPMLVRATLTSARDNVSPIIDIARASIVEVLNVIGPDMDTNSVKHAGIYVSKSTSLITPAEDIKVIFDAKTPGGSSVNVYFKTTPYVARHATLDALATQTASRYDLLTNRNVNIYWRDNVNGVVKKGGFIPVKIGTTSLVTNTSVWVKDIVSTEDLNIGSAAAIAANVTNIFAVEGTLLDTIIPDWVAGTYAFGDTFFHAGGLWTVSNAAGTSTEPVGSAPADWDLIPHLAITSVLTNDPETDWRLMVADTQPAIGANLTVFNEYTYVPDAAPDEAFKSFSVKIEMVSNNAAQVPEVAKLRVLAVT